MKQKLVHFTHAVPPTGNLEARNHRAVTMTMTSVQKYNDDSLYQHLGKNSVLTPEY